LHISNESAKLILYMETPTVMANGATTANKPLIEAMFKAGSHFGYGKSRRHPSAVPYIFGAKNRVEIFDLEKTSKALERAKAFLTSIAATGKQIVLVGGKSESRDAVLKAAQSLNMPYVAGRWIGGTFTNFGEIRRRIEKMEMLTAQREKGELGKYTKKERLLIDREIAKLEQFFSGLTLMKELPKAIFVIDPKRENIAVTEAQKVGIPVVALAGSDCNLKEVDYAIPGNDASLSSITFFVNQIADAIREGSKEAANAKLKAVEVNSFNSETKASGVKA
jgi:small subunit ribosomal protein S2